MKNGTESVQCGEKKNEGIVLHLEKMALFDGDGIRTVVFLKGCPLRCQWCSTPESQTLSSQLGYNPKKCTGCQNCVTVCPRDAIRTSPNGQLVETDSKACNLCFECVTVCTEKARKQYGRQVDCQKILEEVEKDEIFYFHSGGGVTISGGEPLIQPEIVKAILSGCRDRGIHTAIETSGHVSWDRFLKILPLLDTILIDIKIHNPRRHQQLTGHSNERILSNIRKIDQSDFDVELIIRIPLVPGINDSEENLLATVNFCKELKKFKELHILPYHRLGVESYRYLNKKYPLENVKPPKMEMVEEKVEWLKKEGITVKLGG
jgi:pyruvate formate lyase activating enzyme